ncbi:hypothetical protein [Acidiferrobacter sp.]|uniref:hypothetical protein n=1 Tax=Acidiferrobacter sp. TaxID=1872107 RepID=UPI002619608C|nr:hypothetical protein [Acidiferrobacter sp.]
MLPAGQKQMLALALLAGVMTIGTFIYILATPPAYLHRTRDGVAYFTPPVIDPVNGKPLNVDRLAQYYKGNVSAGVYAVEKVPASKNGGH